MGKSTPKIKRATYRSLLEWKTASGFEDEWLVMIKGNPAAKLLTLNEIQDMHYRSPRTPIHVLNNAFRDDVEAEWLRFRELDPNVKKVGIWPEIATFFGYFAAAVGTMAMVLLLLMYIREKGYKWELFEYSIFFGIALSYAGIRLGFRYQKKQVDRLRENVLIQGVPGRG